MDKQAVASMMQQMAEADARFRAVYQFFQDLSNVEGQEYIAICRTRMPHVADHLVTLHPALKYSEMVEAMRNIHERCDADVVKISAFLLEAVIKSVAQAIE